MEIEPAVLEDAIAREEGRNTRDTSRPRFHWKSVEFKNESEKAGKPVFKDVEYVEIIVPGQRKSTVDCKVTDEHRKRWPAQYAAWKGNRAAPATGMPLEQWTLISPAEVENLKYQNVRTVEDLADLTDAQLQECGIGARKLQTKAQAWLKQAKGNAGLSEALAKGEALEARVHGLEDQLARALAIIEAQKRDDGAAPPAAKRTRSRARKPETESGDGEGADA